MTQLHFAVFGETEWTAQQATAVEMRF